MARSVHARIALILILAGGTAARAQETTLYSLQCTPYPARPYAGLAINGAGALFGTSYLGGSGNEGSVYALTPPAGSATGWSEQAIASLGPPGYVAGNTVYPTAAPLVDASGRVFVAAYYGGDSNCVNNPVQAGCGGIFMLTPPATGQAAWRVTTIHIFAGGNDGANPDGALIEDAQGNIYGTTRYGGPGNVGIVFAFSPPPKGKKVWSKQILHRFTDGSDGAYPVSALLMDAAGALYGQTEYSLKGAAGGVLFRLTPPRAVGKAWGFTSLATLPVSPGYQFSTGLVLDANHVLYGTTSGGGINGFGTIFSVTPPAVKSGAWTLSVLYDFADGTDSALPGGGLLLQGGVLYGVTNGTGNTGDYGTAYALAPPAAGGAGWTMSVLHSFSAGADGGYPVGGLVADMAGNLYGVTQAGGADKCGAVFEVSP